MSYLSAGSSNSFSSVVVPTVCVGAAVCVVAYVVWGPDYFLKKRGITEATGSFCSVMLGYYVGMEDCSYIYNQHFST